MTYFELNPKERILLEHIISNSLDARQVLRAYAFWLDDGDSVEEIAQRLGVSRQTIYNWASRFQQRQNVELVAPVADAPRPGGKRQAGVALSLTSRDRPTQGIAIEVEFDPLPGLRMRQQKATDDVLKFADHNHLPQDARERNRRRSRVAGKLERFSKQVFT
ncbi:MAG: helix-turn-helix domain-containing protein [Acidobacteriota bacterium]